MLKAELLERFLPADYAARCYSAFYELKSEGSSLSDFHVRFLKASLKLPDLTGEAKLARYCDVVKPEYALAVKQQRCRTVDETLRATMDIECYSAKIEAAYPKSRLQWKAKTVCAAMEAQPAPPAQLKPITFRRRMEAERMDLRKANKCFICATLRSLVPTDPFTANRCRSKRAKQVQLQRNVAWQPIFGSRETPVKMRRRCGSTREPRWLTEQHQKQ